MGVSSDRNIRLRTVLVVAPDRPNTKSLVALLGRFGYPASVAGDARQALEQAAETRPALIISELVLPDKREGALVDFFQADSRTACVPLFFMIPPGDAGAATRCRASGAGCILKPVRADELYHALQAAIEPRPRATMRIRTALPVLVGDLPLETAGGVCEIDLSEEGMGITSSGPVPVQSRLSVRIRLKGRTVSAEGSIRYARPLPSGRSGMGLKFVKIDPADRDALRRFIEEEVAGPLS